MGPPPPPETAKKPIDTEQASKMLRKAYDMYKQLGAVALTNKEAVLSRYDAKM